MTMATTPTKTQALNAARSYVRYLDKDARAYREPQSTMLMSLGRLYEFPEGTPKFDGKMNAQSIATFILDHAREIE